MDHQYRENGVRNIDSIAIGGIHLPFDQVTVYVVKRFISSAIGKIYRLRKEMLRELEAPWLHFSCNFSLLFLFAVL